MSDNAPFRNRGQPVAETDLAKFERTIGSTLPEPNRSFLLAQNGGRLEPGTHVDREGVWLDVRELFALADSEASYTSLIEALLIYRNRVPASFLPSWQ